MINYSLMPINLPKYHAKNLDQRRTKIYSGIRFLKYRDENYKRETVKPETGASQADGTVAGSTRPRAPSQPKGTTSGTSRSSFADSSDSVLVVTGTVRINTVGRMIKRVYTTGYEETLKTINELMTDNHEQLFVVFLGTKSATGKNWCPDCVIGEDLIEACLETLQKDVIVLFVDVGDRMSWKSLDNPWRKDKVLRLTNIPTIIEWKRKIRLEGEQCLHLDMIKMYFESE